MSKSKIKDPVRVQYETLPYPPRDPSEELQKLMIPEPDCLDKLNFYGFGGNQDFSNNFRVLIAGGGTGDSVISMAEQLYDKNAEIVYLDISSHSMNIAKQRAEKRNLKNITWINDSISNIEKLNLGEFDYINCVGVLHHMEDPDDGLACLKSVLKPNGVMAILVYAPYGKRPIYQMQDLMRHINKKDEDIEDEIQNCKDVLASIPEDHYVKNSPISDHLVFGDSGLYDLFLHKRDRSYDVEQLYKLVEGQDLKIIHFLCSYSKHGNLLYSPDRFFRTENLRKKIKAMPVKKQQMILELFHGDISKHIIYVGRDKIKTPTIAEEEYIPSLYMWFKEDYNKIISEKIHNAKGENVELIFEDVSPYGIFFNKTPNAEHIMRYIDGHTSIYDIFARVRRQYSSVSQKPSYKTLKEEFAIIYNAFRIYDWMYLRAPQVPKFKSLDIIFGRASAFAEATA